MQKYYILYKLSFPNGKIYVGQTGRTFKIRMNGHKHHACNKKCNNYNSLLCRAIRKYSWDNVKKEILLTCGDQIDMYERQYIRLLKATNPKFGYNLESGGSIKKQLSAISRQKLSKTKIGSKNYCFGKVGIGCWNSKAVLQFDFSGVLIAEFPSATEASNYIGANGRGVSSACEKTNARVVAHNFIWIYKADFAVEELLNRIVLVEKRATLGKPIPVVQIDNTTGELIKEWESIADVEKKLSIVGRSISAVCKNRVGFKTAGGFKWKFKNK